MAAREKSEVLIVGGGGREHALGWKLSQSPSVSEVHYAPGNGGTHPNLTIRQNDIPGLLAFARSRENLLAVVGPEEPLSLGIVDAFMKEGLRIFGPTAAAARIEASKAYAKEFMVEARIATARFGIFTDIDSANEYVKSHGGPFVVKADGLAAGKGVIVCDNNDEAIAAIESMLSKKEFGSAGEKIVIEERLKGEEASFIALCDGETCIPLATSQDHKRVFDGDKGPNTGGMGAYSPAPVINDALFEEITKNVMQPAVQTMKKRGTPFTGFLYAGIMIEQQTGRPKVLEFNARMGDPECQPIMMRMKSDLYPYIEAAVGKRLAQMPPIEWNPQTAICVVMAARGYPGSYERGQAIEGLAAEVKGESMTFHAGTMREGQKVLSNGGRVLGVTALGKDPGEAAERAYSLVRRIRWGDNGHQYRTDIARRAIMRNR